MKDFVTDLKNLGWIAITLPVVLCLWVYRNNDKRRDHSNALKNQKQFYTNLKKEELRNAIAVLFQEINELTSIKFEKVIFNNFKDNRENITLKEVIDRTYYLNEVQVSRYSQDFQNLIELPYIGRLKDLYDNLTQYMIDYEKVVEDKSLSTRYAKQLRQWSSSGFYGSKTVNFIAERTKETE